MTALIVLHAGVGLVAALAGRRLGRNVFLLAAVAPAAALAWILAQAGDVVDGEAVTERRVWVRPLGLALTSRLDGFALLMALLIAGIGVLVLIYSRSYFTDRPGLGRFAGLLTAFAGAMLGVVTTDNLLGIYVFWELTSITSFLIIGFDDESATARSAASQAFLVTAAGGLAMLGGFILLGQAAGTYQLSQILTDPPGGGTVGPALLLVLAGAFTKSAQVPFHFWLPAAMAAPTPASTYLHSATMVKAGVYLVARFAPAFAAAHAFWRPLVVGVGVATLLVGGWRALRQTDLKLILAYGTVSQLGFMIALFGAGVPELTLAGAALLLAHGLFKAALFLVAGVVDHAAGTRDLRQLGGLARPMPVVAGAAAVAVASMAGLPPLFGFIAKEAALEGALHAGFHTGWDVFTAGVVLGSVFTAAYGVYLWWGTFGGAARRDTGTDLHRPAALFVAPAALLAAVTVLAGVVPATVSDLVTSAAGALDTGVKAEPVKLWHGVNEPLMLSGLAVAAGLALWRRRPAAESDGGALPGVPRAQAVYDGLVRGLSLVAIRVTGVVQGGSLPRYLTVILATVLALPGYALLTGPEIRWPDRWAESPVQVAMAAVVAGAATGVALARRRFGAVLSLGAAGFGMAALFLVQGAPDLALTQLLIETVSLLIFMLVLRHLPSHFEPTPWPLRRAGRLVIAGGVGVFVAAFALVASGYRVGDPVSDTQIELAVPEAGGRNVVNVILVDFRAFDTLGEITVLAVAAMGIASLVFAGRRSAAE